jgi:hypothetical protein
MRNGVSSAYNVWIVELTYSRRARAALVSSSRTYLLVQFLDPPISMSFSYLASESQLCSSHSVALLGRTASFDPTARLYGVTTHRTAISDVLCSSAPVAQVCVKEFLFSRGAGRERENWKGNKRQGLDEFYIALIPTLPFQLSEYVNLQSRLSRPLDPATQEENICGNPGWEPRWRGNLTKYRTPFRISCCAICKMVVVSQLGGIANGLPSYIYCVHWVSARVDWSQKPDSLNYGTVAPIAVRREHLSCVNVRQATRGCNILTSSVVLI